MVLFSKRQSWSSLKLLFLLQIIVLCNPCSSTMEQGNTLQELVSGGWITQKFSSWVAGTEPCINKWEAIECDSTGSIITLNLTQAGLKGNVPEALGRLTSLQKLNLGNNKNCTVGCGPWNRVTGDLSPLANLVNLQSLILTFNALSLSSFPAAIIQLKKLTILYVDNTLIGGEFPQELSTLPNIQHLYLGNNSFTGTIPGKVIGSMSTLIELTIWGNKFTGTIPGELGNLGNLTYLNLSKNNLFGGLPPELGKLKKLQILRLYKNTFTGPIPDAWSGMISLTEIELNANALYGILPSWLLELPAISRLELSDNHLHGRMTLQILNKTTSPALQFLYLTCNYLEGARPQVQLNVSNYDLDYNCWDNDIYLDSACVRLYNCLNFQLQTNNGTCPACPSGQHLVNATNCICNGDLNASGKNTYNVVALVCSLVAFVVVSIGVISYFIWRSRRKSIKPVSVSQSNYFKSGREGTPIGEMSWEIPKGVEHFTIEELVKATNNFDKAHEIGEGGFGKVFVGQFPDGRTLAIKQARLTNHSVVSNQTQFRNEVLLLSRLHHKNLVRLEGFCDDGNHQILLYEYMQLGNLHNHLHENCQGKFFLLDWYKRLEIAVHVAQGLDYLHSFADPPVIHRDVKSTNILLDDRMIAKVADFGISKESAEIDTHVSTRPAGTAGYFDPQYFLSRQLTTASDVYSYGVVLLELITGRYAIQLDCPVEEDTNIIEWTTLKMEESAGGLDNVVDPRLKGNYPQEIYASMLDLALKCASFKRNLRPSMKAVVTTLEPLLQESERPPQDYTLEPWQLQLDQPSSSPWDATGETNIDVTKLSQGSHTRIENMDTVILPR